MKMSRYDNTIYWLDINVWTLNSTMYNKLYFCNSRFSASSPFIHPTFFLTRKIKHVRFKTQASKTSHTRKAYRHTKPARTMPLHSKTFKWEVVNGLEVRKGFFSWANYLSRWADAPTSLRHSVKTPPRHFTEFETDALGLCALYRWLITSHRAQRLLRSQINWRGSRGTLPPIFFSAQTTLTQMSITKKSATPNVVFQLPNRALAQK